MRDPIAFVIGLLRRLEKVGSFSFKEISLIKSQNISIALIFLYPVLAITALAFALGGVSPLDISFGKSGLESVSIGLVLPGENPYFNPESFRGDLSGFEYLVIEEYASRWELSEAIKKGEVVVGAIILPPESETDFIKASFLYDDSSLFAAGTILSQTQTAINSIGFKKSSEILTDLLQNLDSITNNITKQAEKTDDIIGQLSSTDQQLIDLNESINSIDTNEIIRRLEGFDEYYKQSKADINVTLQDIEDVKGNLQEYREGAVYAQEQIDSVLLPFEGDLNSLLEVADASDEPQKSVLVGLHETLGGYLSEIKAASVGIGGVIEDIDDTEVKLNSAEEKLKLADERLDLAKQEIEGFSQDFEKIGSLIDQSKELVNSTYDSKQFVLSELQGAKRTLNGLIGTLNNLKRFSPEYIVNPISVDIEPVYGITKVASMVPLSIGLILLLTALLLASNSVIVEKERGIYFRLRSAPTTHLSWVSGKIIGQMVFALIEAGIILLIASIAFGVPLPSNLTDLSIAILAVAFAFICIGLFIPEIMKTQATAILSSLLILLPMLFLSGIIFPIEFMPQPVDMIASVLPLSVAINILSGIMIKSASLGELIGEFALLLVPALILLGIVLWRNRG